MLARLRLARWMGPWTSPETAPERVQVSTQRLPGGVVLDRFVAPGRRRRPALLLLHGLHFHGGRDPRMQRFCRVLAACGADVGAPTLPSYQRMDAQPVVLDEAARALTGFQAATGQDTVGVMSISLGCLPATWLAGQPGAGVGGLTLFGAYAHVARVLQWVSRDEPDDTGPLNPVLRPVVYLHLLPTFAVDPAHHAPLRAAWMRFIRTTWADPSWEEPARFVPLATTLARGVPSPTRPLFLEGCNAAPGGSARVREALDGPFPGHDWMPLVPHLQRVRCPVRLIHGADDDVVPHTELDALVDATPAQWLRAAHKTGLYGHSAAGGLPPARVLAQELAALWGSLDAIVSGVPGWR